MRQGLPITLASSSASSTAAAEGDKHLSIFMGAAHASLEVLALVEGVVVEVMVVVEGIVVEVMMLVEGEAVVI